MFSLVSILVSIDVFNLVCFYESIDASSLEFFIKSLLVFFFVSILFAFFGSFLVSLDRFFLGIFFEWPLVLRLPEEKFDHQRL